MKHEMTSDGHLKLELNSRETKLLRYLAERATFVDTPPEEQSSILRLAEQILAVLGQKSE